MRNSSTAVASFVLAGSLASPRIDAADNTAVPPDTLDLDNDGDTDEPIPFDLAGNPRFVDDPNTTDTGNGTPPMVDMGAYEFQGVAALCGMDLTSSAANHGNGRLHLGRPARQRFVPAGQPQLRSPEF